MVKKFMIQKRYNMSEPELYLEDGSKASLFDVCKWWRTTYPKDVFVKKPRLVVEVRRMMDELLKQEKTHD